MFCSGWRVPAYIQIVATSNCCYIMSTNQFIESAARQQAKGDGKGSQSWSGGYWNGNTVSSNPHIRFYKGGICDARSRKFDRRGRKINLIEDPLSTMVCFATLVPEVSEMVRLHRLHPLLIRTGDDVVLNQIIADMYAERLTTNCTIDQAKTICEVLDFTMNALNIQRDSPQEYARRNFGSVATKQEKALNKRLIHGTVKGDSDSESDGMDEEHIRRCNDVITGGNAGRPHAARSSGSAAAARSDNRQPLIQPRDGGLLNGEQFRKTMHEKFGPFDNNPADKDDLANGIRQLLASKQPRAFRAKTPDRPPSADSVEHNGQSGNAAEKKRARPGGEVEESAGKVDGSAIEVDA